jgi:glycine/D-amino acid oxidase-like deaminating enzyme
VLVLDAHEPGWGASGRNNGQVVAALKHEPHEIEERFGKERGGELIRIVGQGPDLVFGLIERYAMQCDARRSGILTAAHSASSLADLKRRVDVWQGRGAPLQMLSRQELATKSGTEFYAGGCFDPRGGSINPLDMHAAWRAPSCNTAARSGAMLPSAASSARPHAGGSASTAAAVEADTVIIATNAYTGEFWPGLRKTFLPARTPQIVSRPLGANQRRTILPDGEIMSTRATSRSACACMPTAACISGGGSGTAGADRDAIYRELARHGSQLFPELGELDWQYRWSGFMAMTPDRYPRLFELAPGVASVLGYSGRGICTATIMGRELARWAAGEAGIDALALPASSFRTLPYYPLRGAIVEGAVLFHTIRDRLAHAP